MENKACGTGCETVETTLSTSCQEAPPSKSELLGVILENVFEFTANTSNPGERRTPNIQRSVAIIPHIRSQGMMRLMMIFWIEFTTAAQSRESLAPLL